MIPLRDRLEFIYKYRDEFEKLKWFKWFKNMRNQLGYKYVKFIGHRAKIELGYSDKTDNADIAYRFNLDYKKIIKPLEDKQ